MVGLCLAFHRYSRADTKKDEKRGFTTFGGASWGGPKGTADGFVEFGFVTTDGDQKCTFAVFKDDKPEHAAQAMAESINKFTGADCAAKVYNAVEVRWFCKSDITTGYTIHDKAAYPNPKPLPPGQTETVRGLEIKLVP
jgi:hypothetical protein